MQSQQYTLTNRLMGDPRPDRLEASEKARNSAKWRAPQPAMCNPHRQHVTMSARVHQVMLSIHAGKIEAGTIAEHAGISRDMASVYLKRARNQGFVVCSAVVRTVSGGRTFHYALTDAGKQYLKIGG